MSDTLLLVLALLIPTLVAPAILLADRRPDLREALGLLAATILLACVIGLAPSVMAGQTPTLLLGEMMPGLALRLTLEPLGLLFALIASGLWIVAIVYSIGYLRANDEANQTRFFGFFALSIAATMGIALAGNFLTLFLFYEMLTLATWPLVTHHGDEDAHRAGRLYLGLLMGTSICLLLPALIAVGQLTGSTEFTAGGLLAGKVSPAVTLALLAACMLGIGKAALIPVHRWLPAAMVAPTPVSALLHAVAVVKAGVFSIVKLIVYVFGTQHLLAAGVTGWLTALAAFTIVAASLVALRADNLKRRLAYSTISQLSYVTLAASLLGALSLAGAALHIVAHAVGKITLFFAAGAIYTAAHKTRVSELRGIGRQMPWTMGAFAIASLSMIGLPPTVGFVSKWYMLSGAMTNGSIIAVAAIIASTLLNAAYLLPIVYHAFFSRDGSMHGGFANQMSANEAAAHEASAPDASAQGVPVHGASLDEHEYGEAPLAMRIALVTTAALTILLFFLADMPLMLARQLQ